MAAYAEDRSVRVQMLLNNGTSQTGQLKTVAVSIGKLALANYDIDKALNIADAISDVLVKDLSEVRQTKISRLMME